MSDTGPRILNPDGLIPLAPFCRAMSFQLPVFTPSEVWEDVVKHGPYNAMAELGKAVDNALNQVGGNRADHESIDYQYWTPEDGDRKPERVHMQATIFMAEEPEQPWVMLEKAPERYRPGLSVV